MASITSLGARLREDEGTSAVEYGLLVAAIAAVIAGVVFAIGTQMRHTFDSTCQAIAASGSVAAPDAARRPAFAPVADSCP